MPFSYKNGVLSGSIGPLPTDPRYSLDFPLVISVVTSPQYSIRPLTLNRDGSLSPISFGNNQQLVITWRLSFNQGKQIGPQNTETIQQVITVVNYSFVYTGSDGQKFSGILTQTDYSTGASQALSIDPKGNFSSIVSTASPVNNTVANLVAFARAHIFTLQNYSFSVTAGDGTVQNGFILFIPDYSNAVTQSLTIDGTAKFSNINPIASQINTTISTVVGFVQAHKKVVTPPVIQQWNGVTDVTLSITSAVIDSNGQISGVLAMKDNNLNSKGLTATLTYKVMSLDGMTTYNQSTKQTIPFDTSGDSFQMSSGTNQTSVRLQVSLSSGTMAISNIVGVNLVENVPVSTSGGGKLAQALFGLLALGVLRK